MASVQFDRYGKQAFNEEFDRFLLYAKLFLLLPVFLLTYFVLRSIFRSVLRKLYRKFQVLSKGFEEVLSSTTDHSVYAATIEKRATFANKLEQIINTIERVRPVKMRDDLCEPSRISEFRSFVSRVQKQVKSDALVASVVANYASLPDAVQIPREQRRWDPEKGEQQLRDLNDILPFIASSSNCEPKGSD